MFVHQLFTPAERHTAAFHLCAFVLLSAPFRKYLNVFIDPTCGWLRTVAQMRGLAYRSIPFRQAGGAAAYLAGPTDLHPHAAVSHFQTMLHCQRRPRQPPTAHSRVRPRNLTLSPPLPLRSLTVAPLQTLQRCDGETTER